MPHPAYRPASDMSWRIPEVFRSNTGRWVCHHMGRCRLKDVQIRANTGAFAAILGDGSVVTWGDADCGGDSSAVQAQLKDVQQIQANTGAFAAILGRWFCRHMGRCRLWWRQQCRARPVEGHSTDPSQQ